MPNVEMVPVIGWPGYGVTRDGDVWSCRTHRGTVGPRWHRLQGRPDRDGYLSVTLYQNGKRRTTKVAHIVLDAFVGPRPPGAEACHWPDIHVTNNSVDNLRWATHADNSMDKVRGGTAARGANHGSVKLSDEQVRAIRAEHGPTNGYKRLAAKYGVSANQIRLIVKRRNWAHLP